MSAYMKRFTPSKKSVQDPNGGMINYPEICIDTNPHFEHKLTAHEIIILDQAAELAALRSEIANYETARQEDVKRLEHRFVTCTWCGWRLDYEADGREAAYATANEHAFSCKADPRTAQLATVTEELDKAESENRFLSGVISGMEEAENEKLEQVTAERDAYKQIIDDVRAGNYNNAHDIAAARSYIFACLQLMEHEAAAALKGGKG